MNYIYKFQEFMKGRYGINDDLNKFLYKLFLILIIINIIFRNLIVRIVYIMLLVIVIYRFVSKKIYIRSNENIKFLKLKKSFVSLNEKSKSQNYIYKKCHKCKTRLRFTIPYKKGIKHSVCPKCKYRNMFLILKNQKIDIIKNK